MFGLKASRFRVLFAIILVCLSVSALILLTSASVPGRGLLTLLNVDDHITVNLYELRLMLLIVYGILSIYMFLLVVVLFFYFGVCRFKLVHYHLSRMIAIYVFALTILVMADLIAKFAGQNNFFAFMYEAFAINLHNRARLINLAFAGMVILISAILTCHFLLLHYLSRKMTVAVMLLACESATRLTVDRLLDSPNLLLIYQLLEKMFISAICYLLRRFVMLFMQVKRIIRFITLSALFRKNEAFCLNALACNLAA